MSENKKIVIAIASVIIIMVIIGIAFYKIKSKVKENTEEEGNVNELMKQYLETDKSAIEYQENVTVDELKAQTSVTGDSEIYDIEEEYDGRHVLVVKSGIKYKVAFAGMIQKTEPDLDEIDEIYEKNSPEYCGIWVEESSRDSILNLFNNSKNTKSIYYIDEQGYLKISEKNNQTDYDKKIEETINSEKQYILDESSTCYIVDDVTGEVQSYNFENMDQYQVYEYFEDEDKYIIFINENTNGQLSVSEIFTSIVELF